jgi:hypothetical protein
MIYLLLNLVLEWLRQIHILEGPEFGSRNGDKLSKGFVWLPSVHSGRCRHSRLPLERSWLLPPTPLQVQSLSKLRSDLNLSLISINCVLIFEVPLFNLQQHGPEVDSSQLAEKFPAFYGNWIFVNICCRVHKDPFMSHINTANTLTSYSFKTRFNII